MRSRRALGAAASRLRGRTAPVTVRTVRMGRRAPRSIRESEDLADERCRRPRIWDRLQPVGDGPQEPGAPAARIVSGGTRRPPRVPGRSQPRSSTMSSLLFVRRCLSLLLLAPAALAGALVAPP